jgi:hypothetical protein
MYVILGLLSTYVYLTEGGVDSQLLKRLAIDRHRKRHFGKTWHFQKRHLLKRSYSFTASTTTADHAW